jgi:puromycin-sensitive aminopeptidase
LIAAATSVVAATGDVETYEHMLERFRNGSTPQEQLRHLYALTEFDDADLILRTCEFAMSDEVKTQNAPFVLRQAIANRYHGVLAWAFVRDHWSQANDRFPSNTIVRMVDGVKLINDPIAVAEIQQFFADHEIKQATNTLAQILERQRVNAALRAREAVRLGEYLQRPGG